MEDMKKPMGNQPAAMGKKVKHNYLIPVVVCFFAILGFLVVINFAIR